MSPPIIAFVGERDLQKTAHRGIEASLALYRKEVNSALESAWVDTTSITPDSLPRLFEDMTGIWCVPGSPYAGTEGALLAIRHARLSGKAFLGTCGGFQHAVMEFARSVLSREAEHEELSPTADNPLIAKLRCSLAETKARVIVAPGSGFAALLGGVESVETFNCGYGINADGGDILAGTELEIVAHDELGQPRAFRLKGHPFFVGTLFQPERKALTGSLHPVVRAFCNVSCG